MLGLITPSANWQSVCEIPIAALEARGVKALLFDLDNTITTWNNLELSAEVKAWFAELNRSSVKGCILSNNSAERIAGVAAALGIAYVARARKPLPSGYQRAMVQLGTNQQNTIMVGDQLFTDILGANLAGIRSFLVKPISLAHEFTGTRINRKLESLVMKPVQKRLRKKGGWQ